MIFHDFPWFSMIFHDFPWFSMIFHDFPWFSMIFHDFPWFSIPIRQNPSVNSSVPSTLNPSITGIVHVPRRSCWMLANAATLALPPWRCRRARRPEQRGRTGGRPCIWRPPGETGDFCGVKLVNYPTWLWHSQGQPWKDPPCYFFER